MTKSTKRKIVTLAAVICVFALAAAGTLAYFADRTDVATNTFTIGKVQIKLSEGIVDENGHTTDTDTVTWSQDKTTKVWTRGTYTNPVASDAEGKVWTTDGATINSKRTKDGNQNKVTGNDGNPYGYALVPGKTVDKDPVVTVLKNSEPSYVRVKVTLDHVNTFLPIFQKHVTAGDITLTESGAQAAIEAVKTFFIGYDKTIWQAVDSKIEGDKITVTFNYVKTPIVAKNAAGNTNLEPIINGVTLPAWVNNEDAASFKDAKFEVTVTAEAIQAEGFADAAAAWTAFDKQMNPTTSGSNTTDPTNP